MEPNQVAVPAGQGWLRVLGWSAALLAALGCASFFAHTARADVLAPSASIEAAQSSASAVTDSPPPATPPVTAAAPGTSGTATDAGEPSDTTAAAVPAPAPDTSANAADGSETATDSADTYGTAFGATDPSTDAAEPDGTSTGTDATATTVASDTAPDAAGCTDAAEPDGTSTGTDATASDAAGCTDAAEPDGTSTGTDATASDAAGCTDAAEPDGTSTGTDATASDAAGCTDAAEPDGTSTGTDATASDAVGCTGAADTSSAPAGEAPAPASGDSTAQASSSHPLCPGRRKGSGAVKGSEDSVPPPSEPALTAGGSHAPGDSETPSGPVGGSPAGSSPASSARPEAPSDLTTIVSLLGGSSLDGSVAGLGLGGRARSGAGTTGSRATLAPVSPLTLTADVGGMIRPQVDHRVVVCEYAVSASVRSNSERTLVARLTTRVDTTQAARSGVTTGEKNGYLKGSRKPGSPMPPAPNNDTPPVPPAPTSLQGSGGSGGMQGNGAKGVVTARFRLIPPRDRRLVALVEKRRRALRLFFLLERPG